MFGGWSCKRRWGAPLKQCLLHFAALKFFKKRPCACWKPCPASHEWCLPMSRAASDQQRARMRKPRIARRRSALLCMALAMSLLSRTYDMSVSTLHLFLNAGSFCHGSSWITFFALMDGYLPHKNVYTCIYWIIRFSMFDHFWHEPKCSVVVSLFGDSAGVGAPAKHPALPCQKWPRGRSGAKSCKVSIEVSHPALSS